MITVLLIYQNSHSLEILLIQATMDAPGSADPGGMVSAPQLLLREQRKFEWINSQSLVKVTS
jgi:hypothetical protein